MTMDLVFDTGDATFDLRVDAARPEVTVGEVVGVLRGDARTAARGPVDVDGRAVAPDTPVGQAGVLRGSVLGLRPRPTRDLPPPSGVVLVEVQWVAGPRAGDTVLLPPGTHLVGRAATCAVVVDDPAVSVQHCVLHVDDGGHAAIEPLAPTNPVEVDGTVVTARTPLAPDQLVKLGRGLVTVGPPAADDRPAGALGPRSGATTTTFNRPPRVLHPYEPQPLEPPTEQTTASGARGFSIITVLGGAIAGIVMYTLTKSVISLVFPVVGVITGVLGQVDAKRRARKDARLSTRRLGAALRDFEAELVRRQAADREQLRLTHPPLPEVFRRARAGSVRLWERRPGHDDFLRLNAGYGAIPWAPPLGGRNAPHPDAVAALKAHGLLTGAPVVVSLAGRGIIGLAGDRALSLAVARALLCQVATHHGPADVTIVLGCSPGTVADWNWAKWLPHLTDPSGSEEPLVGVGPEGLEATLGDLLRSEAQARRTTLVVVDGDGFTSARATRLRALMADEERPFAALFLAPSVDRLPAQCTEVIEVGIDGPRARLRRPRRAELVDGFRVAGTTEHDARECARHLARFDDPDLVAEGSGLPAQASLLSVLGDAYAEPDTYLAAWAAEGPDPPVRGPVALTEEGPFELDMAADGPHALIAGTTGSGKSELLRSVVTSFAARCSPTGVNFVLIDYKGGSAFDVAGGLPHTVGMVTDLDEHLGERALRCLEAELHHRERVLRDAGASDLPAYRALPGVAPMPRLVVVIDEFATMAAELPDFLNSLVGIAQRGRSLGVHLILATQRPAGAVNANIKANTNLRIALRVQDAADSTDVLNDPAAARLPRSRPGRVILRLGPGELVTAQAARVTGPQRGSGPAVTVQPFRLVPGDASAGSVPPTGESAPGPAEAGGGAGPVTELEAIVAATREAARRARLPEPRRPWPDPLPASVDLLALLDPPPPSPTATWVGLADDPDGQAQYPLAIDLADGHLGVFGVRGSGTTTALLTAVLGWAHRLGPDELHVYAVDFGAGELAPLEALPHVGAVIRATETERQLRLLRLLAATVDERRAGRDGGPRLLVVIDDLPAFRAGLDDAGDPNAQGLFDRTFAAAAEVGVHFAITADRIFGTPRAILDRCGRKVLLELADKSDFQTFGFAAKNLPSFRPGLGLDTVSRLEVQLAAAGDLEEAVAKVAARHAGTAGPPAIGVLPALVTTAELAPPTVGPAHPWRVPFGLSDTTLAATTFELLEGDHLLVAGPPRSGRSTTLATIATQLRRSPTGPYLAAVAVRRSPLREAPWRDLFDEVVTDTATVGPAIARLVVHPGPVVLLVDDAETVEDKDSVFKELFAAHRPDVHVIAAGRNDALRSAYSHWTRQVRESRRAILVVPALDYDGDLAGAPLPRRPRLPLLPGRGYQSWDGLLELVQVAVP